MAVRIYGKTINTWKSWESYAWKGEVREREIVTQYEIEYKEYDENGNLVATGTEDFSRERYMQIDTQWVWIWDGVKQNRGNHRAFECMGTVTFNLNNKGDVIRYLWTKYSNAVLIQLRKF